VGLGDGKAANDPAYCTNAIDGEASYAESPLGAPRTNALGPECHYPPLQKHGQRRVTVARMSDGNNPLTIFGDLSRPATTLIEKVSDLIGGGLRPYQIRRVAKAQADAQKILAEADIEISDMQRRALSRMLAEEERSQRNIESVVQRALSDLRDDAAPEKIDDDWLASFFEKARIVSSEEMQRLWGRILAGEANRPGSFSKRTLSTVSDLDRRDAEVFTTLCRFGWRIDTMPYPLVFDFQGEIYTDHGINLDVLIQLDDMGLISFSALAFPCKVHPPEMVASYLGAEFLLSFDEGMKT
jgi:hypothetical protein